MNNSNFKNRLDDVFGGLDQVGFKSDSSLKQSSYEEDKFKKPMSKDEEEPKKFDKFKKTDSIFHESQDVGSWRGRSGSSSRPQFQKRRRPKNPMLDTKKPMKRDPTKYTKYSLEDVKDVTDRSNTQAALAFLNERKRQHKDIDDTPPSSSDKLVFKKPKRQEKDDEKQCGSSSFGLSCGNSKRVMPEAIVGQTKAKKTSKKPKSETYMSSRSNNKLSHLDFDDEDE